MVSLKAIPFMICSLIAAQAYAQMPVEPTGPRALVYKTRKDYYDRVSVLLSEDGKTIVQYPTPSLVRDKELYPYPARLHKGYLMDKRGIGRYNAFLKQTVQEYATLKKEPAKEEVKRMIQDRNPMKELYDCGNMRLMKDPVKELNSIIDKGELATKCKQLK